MSAWGMSGPRPWRTLEADRGVADRAGDIEAVAGLDAGAPGHPPFRNRADRGDAQRQRPRRRDRVAADQRASKARRRRRDPSAKAASQSSRQSPGSASVSRNPSGRAPLAARSERLTLQRLARDRARRIVGEEMHARDERVRGEHEVFAGRRAHQRRVIAQAQARRPGERGEIAGDEIVFAEARRHGKARIRMGRANDRSRMLVC